MPDAIALGELLIDFVPTVSGVSLGQAPVFQKAAGGAPGNVAVGLTRLGVRAGFMGKVGDDPFGHFLADTLTGVGVDISRLRFTREAYTGLAFVSLGAGGERDFLFYRQPSADMLYTEDEVEEDAEYFRGARLFHFGSVSLIQEPSQSATLGAALIAQEAGALVSYDPNLRLSLWPGGDPKLAREGIRLGWRLADVIKVSESELMFLSGERDSEIGARRLWHPGLKLLVLTRGQGGCVYFTPGFRGEVPGFAVEAVDTTGAGDGFTAGLLKGLLDHPEAFEAETALRLACRYANAVGALTATKRGAIPALPSKQQVESFLQEKP